MSDSTLNPRTVDDPRQRPATGAGGGADPAAAEDVDVPPGPGIPVEYKGATISPPDQRRSYS